MCKNIGYDTTDRLNSYRCGEFLRCGILGYTTLQVFKKKISYRTFRCIISLRQPLQRKVIPYDKLIIQQRKPDW